MYARFELQDEQKDYHDYETINDCSIEQNVLSGLRVDFCETDWVLIIEGSSLWHMVRASWLVLFQVGSTDTPDIIDELLDLKKMPRKPLYAVAPEHSLIFCWM